MTMLSEIRGIRKLPIQYSFTQGVKIYVDRLKLFSIVFLVPMAVLLIVELMKYLISLNLRTMVDDMVGYRVEELLTRLLLVVFCVWISKVLYDHVLRLLERQIFASITACTLGITLGMMVFEIFSIMAYMIMFLVGVFLFIAAILFLTRK